MKTFCVLAAAAGLLAAKVATGQDLECGSSCVARWQKCSGEGIPSGTVRPCCREDDHCVLKDSSFGQCRPISRDIPSSWSGEILTCTDPPECDATTIVATLTRLSANLFTDNSDIEVDFFFGDYLDGTTCAQECQDNPDCFVFDETVDGDCTLFGKNLFTSVGNLQPFFDSELLLTKCFLPEPLCDPATREVRQVNPIIAPDQPGSFHQMAADEDTAFFLVDPPSYTLTAAINACRLNRDRLGGCIGFAIESGVSSQGDRVTLLYNGGDRTRPFRGDLADNPRVYDITGCQ